MIIRIFTFRRKHASCRSFTTLFPITSLALKPFVHEINLATLMVSCKHGNENVNPTGNFVVFKSFPSRKSAIHAAI